MEFFKKLALKSTTSQQAITDPQKVEKEFLFSGKEKISFENIAQDMIQKMTEATDDALKKKKEKTFKEKASSIKEALQFGIAIAKPMIGNKGLVFLITILYLAICGIIFNLQLIF